jgi:hypothetical protein
MSLVGSCSVLLGLATSGSGSSPNTYFHNMLSHILAYSSTKSSKHVLLLQTLLLHLPRFKPQNGDLSWTGG